MAEALTLARPYAEAAFSLAKDEAHSHGPKVFESWSLALRRLSQFAASAEVHALMGDPSVEPERLSTILVEVVGGLTETQKNLVLTLALNQRLSVAPEVSSLFDGLRSEHEGVVRAQIRSALPLNEKQTADVLALLTQKFKKPTQAEVVVDPSLIGGVCIVVGDEVIDASVSGKLTKMASALTN
ncbi:MAG: F0F1 ATP synthase subunit delta [Betaproteobacteria bacterium]|nr:F0F1 ATP synthase subunit delta [Betaproteobacteria bacterium]NBT74990.1 F0F1 ATP synthase subunit delta [Betaproteobacteria bacterium]NBY14280.1 F0F1 ATP synthase subunit delta [Betaproteobacteria bacterium]NCA15721.1 F0F1 ATP synthase subunit delta [Betaproteobacteria bacterium]